MWKEIKTKISWENQWTGKNSEQIEKENWRFEICKRTWQLRNYQIRKRNSFIKKGSKGKNSLINKSRNYLLKSKS